MSFTEAYRLAPQVSVIVNASGDVFSADFLSRFPLCRWLLGYGVGLEWVDVRLANVRGLLVCNQPGVNAYDVGVHALALILACARRITHHDRSMRLGDFNARSAGPLYRLRGQTLGMLAFGRSARALSEFSSALGLTLQAHDPAVSPAAMRSLGVVPVSEEDLLSTSDVLSVHLPLTHETQAFLNSERIASMKDGAIVVVTSRGAVYDELALAQALVAGKLAAAGLDVFSTEPLPTSSPLLALSNVVLSPHAAGYSEEAVADQHEMMAASLKDIADGRCPLGFVDPASASQSVGATTR